MSTPAEIEAIVAKFFAARRAGRRVSIDETLADAGSDAPADELRTRVLGEIARQTRAHRDAGSSHNVRLSAGPPDDEPDALPDVPGYDLIDAVGRGGMGVVYEAYQQSTGRRVAVKLILPSGAGQAARRRFEREAELIARLDHPNIISILDSGVNRGAYYYVMEFVDGQPLDRAIPPGRCTPTALAETIALISDAVEYAHQRGVVHRDLKPSNILIDAAGRPRIVDFGLAKSMEPGSAVAAKTTLSEQGTPLGTFAYMSPEQARGALEDVGPRSDVYSLGAVAYELLTGRLPVSANGSLGELLSAIASTDPPPPSAIRADVPRDLDAVMLRCLEKTPGRRYASAAELASDLRRFLRGEPVVARPISAAERLARRMRRKWQVALTAAVSVLVIAAILIVARGMFTARATAYATMVDTMRQMVRDIDPDQAPGIDEAIRTQLARWESLLAEYADEPAMELEARDLIGRTYLLYGEHERAEAHLTRVLELARVVHGESSRQAAIALHQLGRVSHKQTRYADAERAYRAASEVLRKTDGRSAALANCLSDLAWVLKDQDRYVDAEPLYREAIDMIRGAADKRPDDVPQAMNRLAQLLAKMGRDDEAESLLRETLAMRRAIHGERHQHVATSLANLGTFVRERGRLSDAEPLLKEALDIRRAVFADRDPHPTTVVSMNQLGLLYKDMARYDEAARLLRETLEKRIASLGTEQHDFVAVSKHNLGGVLAAMERFDEARPLLEGALRIWENPAILKEPRKSHKYAMGLQSLADLCRAMGEFERAASLTADSLAIREIIYASAPPILGHPAHADVAQSLALVARIILDRGGDSEAAIEPANAALAIYREKLGATSPRTIHALLVLADAQCALNRRSEVLATLTEALDAFPAPTQPQERLSLAAMHLALADYNREAGRDRDGSLALCDGVIEARRAILGEVHSATLAARFSRARLLADRGEHDEALLEFDHVVAGLAQALGETHTRTLAARTERALCRLSRGDAEEAASETADVAAKAVLPLDIVRATTARAAALAALGRNDEAIALLDAPAGAPIPPLLDADRRVVRGRVQLAEEDFAAAETELAAAADMLASWRGPTHLRTGIARNLLGYARYRMGQIDEAEAHVIDGFKIIHANLAPHSPPEHLAALRRAIEYVEARQDDRMTRILRSYLPAGDAPPP